MFDSTSSYIDFQSSQTKNNTHTFTYLTPFKKPRVETSSQIETTRLQQKTEKVNFSNFSIPAVFLKSTRQEKESKAIASPKFQQQKPLTELLSTLDEHSEAADRPNSASGIREKRKASDINVYNEPASSSTCSLEASNDPNFSFRDHEDNYDSQYLSDVSGNYKPLTQTQDTTICQHSHVLDTTHTFNMKLLCYSSLLSFGLMLQNEEETSENMLKEKPAHSVKRSYKNAKSYNLTQRKRRDKINEQIHRLKELIPNCNKMDKASMLDDAIDYLKTLKLQLQIMTMGRGLCMPLNHLMMLPAHHMNMNMNAQHLMGFRPQVQFPIPQMSNGVTDNNNIRFQMFGFSNQLPPPISIHNAPFMLPVIGNSSTAPTSFGNQNQPSRTCG